jgi:undecaprenyl phosphate N,N'-diacetylbacillosamine 1-phosphate transferase
VEPKQHQAKFYERVVKRFLDIMISVTGLVLLSPFMLVCMLAIKLDDRNGAVFFKHERNGKAGKVFKVVKFRTMKTQMCGELVEPTADTLTRVGKLIRKLSFDEIPQFFNILKGEMSLIGPRPLPLRYYAWFSETERRRFEVRPGLTGLSQINGRINLNWDERFSLDVQYADNLSLLGDLKIFFRTFPVIFSHKNALPEENNILENFDEYRKKQLQAETRGRANYLPGDGPLAYRPAGVDKTDFGSQA